MFIIWEKSRKKADLVLGDIKKKFVIRDDGRKAKDEEGNNIQKVNDDGIPAWTIKGYHDVEPRIPEEIFNLTGQKLNFRFDHDTKIETVLNPQIIISL